MVVVMSVKVGKNTFKDIITKRPINRVNPYNELK